METPNTLALRLRRFICCCFASRFDAQPSDAAERWVS